MQTVYAASGDWFASTGRERRIVRSPGTGNDRRSPFAVCHRGGRRGRASSLTGSLPQGPLKTTRSKQGLRRMAGDRNKPVCGGVVPESRFRKPRIRGSPFGKMRTGDGRTGGVRKRQPDDARRSGRNALCAAVGFQPPLDLDFEVAQHVHVVDERLVGRAVRVEVAVYVAVREPFGRHVVEVIGALHEAPDVVQVGAVQFVYFVVQRVQFRESLVLQFVAEPCGYVAFFVGPRNRVGRMQDRDGLVCLGHFGGVANLSLPSAITAPGRYFMNSKIPDSAHWCSPKVS